MGTFGPHPITALWLCGQVGSVGFSGYSGDIRTPPQPKSLIASLGKGASRLLQKSTIT